MSFPVTGVTTPPQRASTPQLEADGLEHYVLPMYEVVAGTYRDVPSRGDGLTILSTHPVRVYLDGRPVTKDDFLAASDVSSTARTFLPRVDTGWAGYTNRTFSPALSFTIRRSFQRLSILANDPGSDFANGFHPGIVHMWIHSGGVESASLGVPVHHMLGEGYSGVASNDIDLLLIPSVDALAGRLATPSWMEFLGVVIDGTWSSTAGIVTYLSLEVTTSGTSHTIAQWYVGAAFPLDVDFGHAIGHSGYNALQFNSGDSRGRLVCNVLTSQTVTALTVNFRMRSFL